MRRVRIIHWKPDEAGPLLEACRKGDFLADCDPDTRAPAIGRKIRENPPDVIVIDLSRLPGHGLEMAIWLRGIKSTRNIPLVFVNGTEEKQAKVRGTLPDAIFSDTARLLTAVQSACGQPMSSSPVVPPPMMERYATKTAARKLGIAPTSTVGVMDAPRDYASVLGELPENVELIEDPATAQDVMLWFVIDSETLDRALRRMSANSWIVWPKASKNGVTPASIRQTAFERGFVDYKICSVNVRWSAMRFARGRT